MNVSDKQLDAAISAHSLICVRRDGIDSRSMQVFPLAYSDRLLLCQYVCDFRIDGQLILRREDITSVSCRATDAFQRKLLEDNGVLQRVDFDFDVPLTSFSTVLDSLSPASIVILENESLDDSEFWIGRYMGSDGTTIRIHEFTGAGNWHDSVTELETTDVTCCQLNTNYINIYAKYFGNNPPTQATA